MSIDIKNYKDSVIIFLDMLGIRNFIKKHEKKNLKFIKQAYEALENIKDYQEKRFQDQGIDLDLGVLISPHYDVSILSDSMVFTLDVKKIELIPSLMRLSQLLTLQLLAQEIPIRGYITIGKCYHDPERSILFGGGLIDAYENERKQEYPRILIDDCVFYRLKKIYDDSDSYKRLVGRYVREHPNMKGIDAFFEMMRLYLTDGVAKDSMDNKNYLQFLSDPVARNQDLLKNHEGLDIPSIIEKNVLYYSDIYEHNKSDANKRILDKWLYLRDKAFPIKVAILRNKRN